MIVTAQDWQREDEQTVIRFALSMLPYIRERERLPEPFVDSCWTITGISFYRWILGSEAIRKKWLVPALPGDSWI